MLSMLLLSENMLMLLDLFQLVVSLFELLKLIIRPSLFALLKFVWYGKMTCLESENSNYLYCPMVALTLKLVMKVSL